MIEAVDIVVNKSKSYLLPLFDTYLKLQYIQDIVNTYTIVEDEAKPCFAILYKFNPEFEFKSGEESGYIFYESELEKNSLFIKKIDINDYTLFIFNVPEDLNYEYSCFLEGKYSWFRRQQKLEIINFLTKYFPQIPQVVNTIVQVLSKSESLKQHLEKQLATKIPDDIELSSKVILEEETFKIENF